MWLCAGCKVVYADLRDQMLSVPTAAPPRRPCLQLKDLTIGCRRDGLYLPSVPDCRIDDALGALSARTLRGRRMADGVGRRMPRPNTARRVHAVRRRGGCAAGGLRRGQHAADAQAQRVVFVPRAPSAIYARALSERAVAHVGRDWHGVRWDDGPRARTSAERRGARGRPNDLVVRPSRRDITAR